MLRSSIPRLHEKASRRYVCWQCLSKLQQQTPSTNVRQTSSIARPSRPKDIKLKPGQRQFNSGQATRATIEAQHNSDLPQEPSPFQSSIRERLRKWELENASSFNPVADEHILPIPGTAFNDITTRPPTGDFFIERDDENGQDGGGGGMLSYEFDLVDVGLRRNFLLPGDMVELLSFGGSRSELGIFIQEIEKQGQYYTMSGRWIHRGTESVKFFVPNFVEAEALEEIKPYLPKEAVPPELQDKLISFDDTQVPRSVGKPLIQKMLAFWDDADKAYQAAATKMDNAHELVAHPVKFSYAALPQIANRILSDTLPKMDDGNFSYPVLYALHRTIMQDDIGFIPRAKQVMRGESEYEINSLKEVALIRRITEKVREMRSIQIARRRGDSETESRTFEVFVKRAQQIIDASREFRDFTECGVLGPSRKIPPKGNIRVGDVITTFQGGDQEWIYFLESWACLKSLPNHSSLNGIGSNILRAIGRYDNVPLNRTTAFTCLMEMGLIPPWETQASFDLRLPYANVRFDNRFNSTHGVTNDRMASVRKDWGDVPVYCIDDSSAHEIDDGISVESTESSEEFWLHVHTADPAAHLEPESPAAQYAELVTKSVYLPDRMMPMLNSIWTDSKLSLAPNRRCLTYSTKINLAGDTLDIKVTAGSIKNVIYLTPETLSEIVLGKTPPESAHRVVGKDSFETFPSRPLAQKSDLSTNQLSDLKLIYKLSLARRELLDSKGALRQVPGKASTSVSFGGAPWVKPKFIVARYHGDPTIRLSIPPTDEQGTDLTQAGGKMVVSMCMLLACESAAHWCQARGIPVINRISPFNPGKEDPVKFYHEHVRPSMDETGFPKLEVAMQYLTLIGKTQPSTTPGPHLGIGSDMTMQVTSPLRRFGDLLNQWQIEATLLEEARTGTSLVGNEREHFLPFSKARIDALLPRLAERERLLKEGEQKADREWILKYLVRAWKFGEDELPSPLLFYARSVNVLARTSGGILPSYLVGGIMGIPKDMEPEEIQVGDVFEVKIANINCYERHLDLEFVRRLPPSEVESLRLSMPRSDPLRTIDSPPETSAMA